MNNKEIRPVDNIKLKEESIIPDNTYKREMTEYSRTKTELVFRKRC